MWSFAYAALGVLWSFGGPGFPYGRGADPSAELTLFEGATPGVGGPLIAAVGVVSGLIAVAMARRPPRGMVAWTALGFAWSLAGFLLLVVPDYRPLLAVAYAPLVLLGAPFDWPPDVALSDVLPWPVVNQLLCMGGGVLWAAAAVVYRRRITGSCQGCGRGVEGRGRAETWGTWATYVAVAVPLVYAATRLAWALGIPIGITEEFLREGRAMGLWWAGAALAALAVGGAFLTLGLVRPWGEVVPRWIPIVGGRSVPPALPLVLGLGVAILVTSAGLMFIRLTLTGALVEVFAFGADLGWVALAPELLWPVWGAALAVASLAYHRRRVRCPRCGRL